MEVSTTCNVTKTEMARYFECVAVEDNFVDALVVVVESR